MGVEFLALRRRRYVRFDVVLFLGGLLALALVLPAGAVAARRITFVAPAGARAYPDKDPEGPVGFTEAPDAFRTTQVRPVIGIEANAGTRLQCHPDSVFVTKPCGPRLPGCNAAVCASYRPSSPLAPDSTSGPRGHFLAVDLVDSNGNTLDSEWLNLDVDTTAPVTRLGRIGIPSTLSNPFRPTFTFEVGDDNGVGGSAVDHADCSWTRTGRHPVWAACRLKNGGGSFSPPRLAHRHRLYVLGVRGTDDFGRSTTASASYDPVPCALALRRPANLSMLLSSGIQMRVSCDTLHRAEVGLYAYALNGRRYASPRGAVSELPLLGLVSIRSRPLRFTVRRRLRLYGAARREFRQARSLSVVFAAGAPDNIEAGIADDTLSYATLTLHR